MQLLERIFKLKEHGTNVRTEIVAGLTTFLTMAYIIFVNPSILSAAGMPADAVFVATCLIAALGTAIMALYANYPIALAPGMGLNAYFAFVVVGAMGYKWQTALGAVFISGCLFLAITLLGLRELIVRGIPQSIRTAIVVGIGMFLAIIALKSAGIVVASPASTGVCGRRSCGTRRCRPRNSSRNMAALSSASSQGKRVPDAAPLCPAGRLCQPSASTSSAKGMFSANSQGQGPSDSTTAATAGPATDATATTAEFSAMPRPSRRAG